MNFSKLIMANFILVFGYVTFVGETPSSAILLLKSFLVTKEFSTLPPILNFQMAPKYMARMMMRTDKMIIYKCNKRIYVKNTCIYSFYSSLIEASI